uniref:GCFC domain-containing protein n=1 Tax=Mesocestoides corti TaxID=53468 RepID=A0A5K3EIS1_MESCO
MADHLSVVFAYLKLLQYFQLANIDCLPQEQRLNTIQFLEQFSRVLKLMPEDRKLSLTTFISAHRDLFPQLNLELLGDGAVCIDDSAIHKGLASEETPFFLERSHIWTKLQHCSSASLTEYLDWCWVFDPPLFITLLMEILEYSPAHLTEKIIPWIQDALLLDDAVLIEFLKQSCGRLRDVCVLHPNLASGFSSAIQRAREKTVFQVEPHRSNLLKHFKCFQLAGFFAT